jgi:class 3 adenylate cyclase
MPRPSLNAIKWFALCFGAVFAVSSAAEYLFVNQTSRARIRAELGDDATKLNREVAYQNGVDPRQYFKASIETSDDYIIVLRDGAILDTGTFSRRPIGRALPTVQCPILTDPAFSGPVTKSYSTETIRPEEWTITAKRLRGGTLIIGFSSLDEVPDAGEKAVANLEYFGDTVEEAVRTNASKLDNSINWAVLSDASELLDASGRLPLKTDAMLVGQMSNSERDIPYHGKRYLVVYNPLLDVDGHPAGTIIQFKDITWERQALRSEAIFNTGVATVSFAVFLALAAFYSARQEGEKRAIREAFQHYFSPQIMEAILREPELLKLGGQRREVRILFSDIRSFTGLSEKLPPQELTRLLHEYFDAMTDEVFATEGIVDKYVGDALMAFWGAPIDQPDQADRAVRTAINMVGRLKQLREKWRSEGVSGDLDAGIVINLGIATVGNLGSTRRFDYTLVGDAVNAASRIEQLNKEYKSHIIISETTKAQLTISVPTKDLGDVQVRGRERPIRVYEVDVDARHTE